MGKKDPVANFERYLKTISVLNDQSVADIREGIQKEIEAGLANGFAAPHIKPDTAEEISDVYAPIRIAPTKPGANGADRKLYRLSATG